MVHRCISSCRCHSIPTLSCLVMSRAGPHIGRHTMVSFHYILRVICLSGGGLVGNVIGLINKVNRHRARLVLGWMSVSVCNQPPRSTQPGHPSVGRRSECQQKLGRKGRKQAHCDALSSYPWSCSVNWCLAEALETEISATL